LLLLLLQLPNRFGYSHGKEGNEHYLSADLLQSLTILAVVGIGIFLRFRFFAIGRDFSR
jgi:hypothetical protein